MRVSEKRWYLRSPVTWRDAGQSLRQRGTFVPTMETNSSVRRCWMYRCRDQLARKEGPKTRLGGRILFFEIDNRYIIILPYAENKTKLIEPFLIVKI